MRGMCFEQYQSDRYLRVFSLLMAAFVAACVFPSFAHAHGMNVAEMAPPIMTSGLLAFVCYWLVVLWPASKGAETDRFDAQPSPGADQAIRIKRKPRLRVIETKPQLPDEQLEARRAADG